MGRVGRCGVERSVNELVSKDWAGMGWSYGLVRKGWVGIAWGHGLVCECMGWSYGLVRKGWVGIAWGMGWCVKGG